MNSWERMNRAMKLEKPDRVPVMCQLSLGHYFLQAGFSPLEIWYSSEAFGEALIRLQERYRFDGLLINLPGRDPRWSSYIRKIEDKGGQKILHWQGGWKTVFPSDDNPHVFSPDDRKTRPTLEEIDPEILFYIEPHDLSGVKYPFFWGFSGEIPDPDNFFPPWHFDTVDYVVRRVHQKISIHGEIFSPFSQWLELLGYEPGLMALKVNPSKTHACLEALTRGTIEYGCRLAGHKVDAILISSAFAGAGFISPRHYAEFVLPYEKKVIQGIKARYELPVYIHTCGKINDRLELMMMTGANGLDTLDPPPLGNIDLAEAKRRVGKQLFLKGNIDPVNVVWKGTPEMVAEAAYRCLKAAKEGGGYILSTACSVPPGAPPENVRQIAEVAEIYGKY